MFLMRIVWPIGSVVGNSWATSVWPMTQTLAAPADVALGEELAAGQRPVADERGSPAPTPNISLGFQLTLP